MFVHSLFPPSLFIFVCLPVFHMRGFSTFLDQGQNLKCPQYGLSVNHPVFQFCPWLWLPQIPWTSNPWACLHSVVSISFIPIDIGFLILHSVKSIFTLPLNFLLQLFWCLCFHFLWFFFLSLWVIPCLFIYLFVALLSFQWHFRRE